MHAGGEVAVLRVHEGLVGGNIDTLQHRGQNAARRHAVLVRVDTDGQLAGIGSCLDHAGTGTTGSVIDNISATVDLRLGQLGALGRVVPCGRCRAGHVLIDLGTGVDGLDAADIAAGKPADEADIHATDKADFAGL